MNKQTKKWKRGDVNPDTGLVYFDMLHGKERWVTKDTFDKRIVKMREYLKNYQSKNREMLSQMSRARYLANIDERRRKNREYAKAHPEQARVRINAYNERNREKIRAKALAYQKSELGKLAYSKRMLNNPLFRHRVNLASRIWKATVRKSFSPFVKSVVGCSAQEFREKVESMFLPGMNWENRGKWHLDHIIPLSLAVDIAHLEALMHHSNTQPLWNIDNVKKSNKIPAVFPVHLARLHPEVWNKNA